MTTTPRITLDLFGETREFELIDSWGSTAGTVAHLHGVVGTIGAGAARYPTSLTLWRIMEGDRVYRGNTVVIADDGSRWQFNLSCVIRNRNNARVVGWADVAGVTNTQDQARS